MTMTMNRTHGFARRSAVPRQLRDDSRVCGKCDLWFVPRPRESVCDGCVPKRVLCVRLASGGTPVPEPTLDSTEQQVEGMIKTLSRRLMRNLEPGRHATAMERQYAAAIDAGKSVYTLDSLHLQSSLALEASH